MSSLITANPGRKEAFSEIGQALEEASDALTDQNLRCELGRTPEGSEVKLFVERDTTRIKIEVNHVFRGTLLPVTQRSLSPTAEETFFTDLELPVLNADELYGSKLVAAMDRQHPRDLFDMKECLQADGLTPDILECYVGYLAGHNRPVHEVLFGNRSNIEAAFTNEFEGMSSTPVKLEDLVDIQEHLFSEVPKILSEQHRAFLVGLVRAEPNWHLMKCAHLEQLPALKWKLQNLERLKQSNPEKFAQQADELEERFAKL